MSTINSNNANVSYNYQKTPNLTIANDAQSKAGLTIAMRDRTNINRNVQFVFPVNMATPNFGAGSPTLLSRSSTQINSDGTPNAGKQI